jgi:membrane protein implicated in regulation of membrane protease activity
MNWPAIFLGCFVIGFVLSALSFALGATHAHLHIHVPWGHHIHGDIFRGGHGGHGGHADAVGPINFATLTAFLAWFGGSGYLLTSEFRWLAMPAILMSIVIGLAGAAIVFVLMAKVLWSPNENMQSADYHMVGVLGRLSQPIREGGIGELIYSHGGARKSCGARTDDGTGMDKGAEVVVTGYDRGIATVRRWSDLARTSGGE